MAHLDPNWNARLLRHAAVIAPYSSDNGLSHSWARTKHRTGPSSATPDILSRALRPQNDSQQNFPTLPSITSALTSSAVPHSVDAGVSQAGQGTTAAAFDGYQAQDNDYDFDPLLTALYDNFSQFIGDDSSVHPRVVNHDYSHAMAFDSAMPPLSPGDTTSETSSGMNAVYEEWENRHNPKHMQRLNDDQEMDREPFLPPNNSVYPNFSEFPHCVEEFFHSPFYNQTGQPYMFHGNSMMDESMGLASLKANNSHMTPTVYRGKSLWLNSDEDVRFNKGVKSENTDIAGSTKNVISTPADEVEGNKSKPSPGPSREIFSSESPPSSGEDELMDDTAEESPSPAMAIDRPSSHSSPYQKRPLARTASPRSPTSRNSSSRYTQSKDVVGTDAIRTAGKNRRKSQAKFHCTYGNCTSEFTRRHNLNNHVKTHLGQAGTHCEKCGKELAQSSRRRHENKCNVQLNPLESP